MLVILKVLPATTSPSGVNQLTGSSGLTVVKNRFSEK